MNPFHVGQLMVGESPLGTLLIKSQKFLVSLASTVALVITQYHRFAHKIGKGI